MVWYQWLPFQQALVKRDAHAEALSLQELSQQEIRELQRIRDELRLAREKQKSAAQAVTRFIF